MAKFTIPSQNTKFDPVVDQLQPGLDLGLTPISSATKFSLNEQSDRLNSFSNVRASDYGENVSLFESDAEAQSTLDEVRAQKQSSAEQLFKGLGHIGSTLGTEILKTPGYLLGGLGALGNDKSIVENIVDNDWVNAFESLDEGLKAQMPVHLTKEVQEGNIGRKLMSSAWWATTGADGIGFLLSMYVPGQAVKALGIGAKIGSGLQTLAKEAKFAKVLTATNILKNTEAGAKMTAKGIQRINSTAAVTMNTYIESAAEAANTFDNVKKTFLESNPDATDEQASKIASEAAANVMKANVGVLALSNVFDELFLFKGFGRSAEKAASDSTLGKIVKNGILDVDETSKLKRLGVKDFLKRAPAKLAVNFGKEGLFEEGLQTQIQKHYENVASGKTKASFSEDVLGDYFENLMNDPDMQEAVVLGGILGGGASMFGLASDIKAKNQFLFGKGNSMPSFLGKLIGKKEKKENKGFVNIMNENFINSTRTIHDIADKDDQGNVITNAEGKIQINEEKLKNLVDQKEGLLLLNQLHNLAILEGNKAEETYFGDLLSYNYFLPFLQQEGGYEVLKQHVSNQLVEVMAKKEETITGVQPTEEKKEELKASLLKKVEEYKKVYDEVDTTTNTEVNVPIDNAAIYGGWKVSVRDRKMQALVSYNSARKVLDEITLTVPNVDEEIDLDNLSPTDLIKHHTSKIIKVEYEKRAKEAKDKYAELSDKKGLREDYDAYKNRIKEDLKVVEETVAEEAKEAEKIVEAEAKTNELIDKAISLGYNPSETVMLEDEHGNRVLFDPKTGLIKNASGNVIANTPNLSVIPKSTIQPEIEAIQEFAAKQEQVSELQKIAEIKDSYKEADFDIESELKELKSVIANILVDKVKGKNRLKKQHKVVRDLLTKSAADIYKQINILKNRIVYLNTIPNSEEIIDKTLKLINEYSNIYDSLNNTINTHDVFDFIIRSNDKGIESLDSHFADIFLPYDFGTIKNISNKDLNKVIAGDTLMKNNINSTISELVKLLSANNLQSILKLGKGVIPSIESIGETIENLLQPFTKDVVLTPEQRDALDNKVFLTNAELDSLVSQLNIEDDTGFDKFQSDLEKQLQKEYREVANEVLDKTVDSSQKANINSSEIAEESPNIRDIFLDHALPSTPFSTTGVSVLYDDKGKDQVDAEGFPILNTNEYQKLWFQTIDELSDTITDYTLTPVRATYQGGQSAISPRIIKEPSLGFTLKSISQLIGTQLKDGDSFTASSYDGKREGNRNIAQFEIRQGKLFINNIEANINSTKLKFSSLEFKGQDAIPIDDVQQTLSANFPDVSRRGTNDIFVFLTDKDGNKVKRDGVYVFTSVRKADEVYPQNGKPRVAPDYILNEYLNSIGILGVYTYDDIKNQKINDFIQGKPARTKLKDLIDNDNTGEDLFTLAVDHGRKEYQKFLNELATNVDTTKRLQIEDTTKGYPLYQLDENGKKRRHPVLDIFNNISLRSNTFGTNQLVGAKLGVVVDTQLKVKNKFVKLPQGSVYLQFDNDEFIVLQSRKLNDTEVRTVLHLLSLADGNKPLNTISVDSPDGYILNGKNIGKKLPVFFKKTQTGEGNFSLLETMINYGLRAAGKNKKGEIYIQSGNVVFTDFDGVLHKTPLADITEAFAINNSDKIKDLTEFLKQKNFNINNTMLANNPKFQYPTFVKGKLQFKNNESYYSFILGEVLTTSSVVKSGYPKQLQRNIVYNPKLGEVSKAPVKEQAAKPVAIPEATKTKKEDILKRYVEGYRNHFNTNPDAKPENVDRMTDVLINNKKLLNALETEGYDINTDDFRNMAAEIFNISQEVAPKRLSPAERLAKLKGEKTNINLSNTPSADKRINPEELLERYIKNKIVQKICK